MHLPSKNLDLLITMNTLTVHSTHIANNIGVNLDDWLNFNTRSCRLLHSIRIWSTAYINPSHCYIWLLLLSSCWYFFTFSLQSIQNAAAHLVYNYPKHSFWHPCWGQSNGLTWQNSYLGIPCINWLCTAHPSSQQLHSCMSNQVFHFRELGISLSLRYKQTNILADLATLVLWLVSDGMSHLCIL